MVVAEILPNRTIYDVYEEIKYQKEQEQTTSKDYKLLKSICGHGIPLEIKTKWTLEDRNILMYVWY